MSIMRDTELRSVLIFDIETDSVNVNKANMKWFGAYSYKTGKHHIIPGDEVDNIKNIIKDHKILVGFNCVQFDIPIIKKSLDQEDVDKIKYKNVIDLLTVSKLRLPSMGIKPNNYKLKTIVNTLKLDDSGKGDIDYNIFKKKNEELTNEEIVLIKEYILKDVEITKELFEWFTEQFKPIRQFLTYKDVCLYNDIKTSTASLAYRCICNMSGVDATFSDSSEEDVKISGGHHILARDKCVVGNLVTVDVVSAYPHAMMMCNLLSPAKKGEKFWDGNGFYDITGKYKVDKLGDKEETLQKIFIERLKAKKEGDKVKANGYKIIINSFYGSLNNQAFEQVYNPVAAGDCTEIARTWLNMMAKYIENSGVYLVYGFTDSIMVLLPEHMTKDELIMVINNGVKLIKSTVPFPMETFNFEVEKDMKMIWFASKFVKKENKFLKNCYLWVDKNDEVGYRSTLFNRNTPKIIMKLFNEYMKPKIIKELKIEFTEDELMNKLKSMIKDNISLAAEEYVVKNKNEYNSHNSLQYSISEKYGDGQHFLIPNLKLIGIGKDKSTKLKTGTRYCTYEEFVENGLTENDIDIKKMMKHLTPFYVKINEKHTDSTLNEYLKMVDEEDYEDDDELS